MLPPVVAMVEGKEIGESFDFAAGMMNEDVVRNGAHQSRVLTDISQAFSGCRLFGVLEM